MIFLYPFLYISALSPRWNETFTFIIQVPELALIRFVVENQSLITGNEFLGQYTLPLLCMNKGNVLKRKMILLSFICTSIEATLGSHQMSPSLHLHQWDMTAVLNGPVYFLLRNCRDLFLAFGMLLHARLLG